MKVQFKLLALVLLIIYSCDSKDEMYYGINTWSDDTYNESYTDYGENPFVNASEQPISTFAIDADGGSYSNMRRFLHVGQRPPTASVRIEEYINYFTFDYPEPLQENVSINSEVSVCPWQDEHFLLRVGLKGKDIPEHQREASNLVLLIDVSGSMNSPDKLGILKTGFSLFVDELRDDDRITIVTYAGQAGLLLPSTSGAEKELIKDAINSLGAGGSTAGAAGITTAYEIAEENFINNGNNRIILGTDGDFNVGPSSDEELVDLIEEMRETGIFLTVLGVGGGNLNDSMMEQIADHGNGNHEYIDNVDQLRKVFIYEFSKFYTVAKDCKIQISFNSETVQSYRLIGYENRALENEEFEDDSTDAGEIGANQTITAFYELIPLVNETTNLNVASLEFRYKLPTASNSRLMHHEIAHNVVQFEQATENMRFGASVTAYGLLMKDSEYKGTANFDDILTWAENAASFDNYGFKEEFVDLVEDANMVIN